MDAIADQVATTEVPTNVKTLLGKSWTAYISVAFIGLILLMLSTAFFSMSTGFGAFFFIASVAYIAYRVLLIRSYDLYYDDVGVWLYSGVLPWRKGTVGVKWRDLDEAVYFQTFWSWIFKSYTIRIGHRFTKTSEILLTHMARGHESVFEINGRHQDLVRNNALN